MEEQQSLEVRLAAETMPALAAIRRRQKPAFAAISAGGNTTSSQGPSRSVILLVRQMIEHAVLERDDANRVRRRHYQDKQHRATNVMNAHAIAIGSKHVSSRLMRHGYKAREGEWLKDERRELVQQRNEYCH